MIRITVLILILSLVSACGSNSPAETPVPTAPPLEGRVQITSPLAGSIIYAETLAVGGTLEDVEEFKLEIETVDGTMLFDGIIRGGEGFWTQEVIHGYAGEPIEAVMRTKSTNPSVRSQYGEVPILISSLAYREDGLIAQILSPANQQNVGGDAIEIMGSASGIPNNRLILMLRHDEGLLDKQVIPLDNPYQIDERVWVASLLTNGYLGEATVELAYIQPETESEQIIDTISIVIGSAAG